MYSTSQQSAKLLVGNKIDVGAREVSIEEANEFARKQAMMYIETSAKSRTGIRQTFEELVQKVLETPELLDPDAARPNAGLASSEPAAGGCSC